jgi:hypothetical protein
LVRSGWDATWTASLSALLTDENHHICKAWVDELRAKPVALCDALVSCQKPAEYWLSWHNCDGYLICDEHLRDCIYEVNEQASVGGIYCDDCRKVFPILPRVMTWRLV